MTEKEEMCTLFFRVIKSIYWRMPIYVVYSNNTTVGENL